MGDVDGTASDGDARQVRQGRLSTPPDVKAAFEEAVAHHLAGELAEAERCYRAVLALAPRLAPAHNNLAHLLEVANRPEEAIQQYQEALASQPDLAEAFEGLGRLLLAQGQYQRAEAPVRQAVLLQPGSAAAHFRLGFLLLQLGRPGESVDELGEAVRLAPEAAEAHYNLAQALRAVGRDGEALEHYLRVADLSPAFGEARVNAGNILMEAGRVQEAVAQFEAATAAEPRRADFYYNLASAKRFSAQDPALAAMEALARDAGALAPTEQVRLHFALGKAFGDTGRPAEAFQHLLAGNRLMRQHIDYDEQRTLELFRRIQSAFSAEVMGQLEGMGHLSEIPVLVIGMPRSGTTLVEQILASHPAVFGAGELTELATLVETAFAAAGFPEATASIGGDNLRKLGADYVAGIRRLAPEAGRIVDKMPFNFRFAGLVHLALPGARMVHVLRDPLDTCLSCFSTLFSGSLPFAYDLAELGRFYHAYEELMEHWRRVLPPGAMLEIRYEDLVADLDLHARRIIDYCGLEWDDACLSFHQTERSVRTASAAQVRQPIYRTSIGRWEPYREFLAPLFQALGRTEG